jgi:hypothetical protein
MSRTLILTLVLSLVSVVAWADDSGTGTTGSSPLPPVDPAMVNQYRMQLLADPALQNRVQGAMRDPYSNQTDVMIDKGYEKVFGRQPSALEKEYVRHEMLTQDPYKPLSDISPDSILGATPQPSEPSDPLADPEASKSSDDIWNY